MARGRFLRKKPTPGLTGKKDMTNAERVLLFHQTFKQPAPGKPTKPTKELLAFRLRLIVEEMDELLTAIDDENMIEMVKEANDLIYVLYGFLVALGVNADITFEEVHRSNMAKKGGGIRSDGKVLKPDGWTKPDIESILRRAGWDPETGKNGQWRGQDRRRG